MGVPSRAETAYPFGAHEFSPVFSSVRVAQSFVFHVVFCDSWYVLYHLNMVLSVPLITQSASSNCFIAEKYYITCNDVERWYWLKVCYCFPVSLGDLVCHLIFKRYLRFSLIELIFCIQQFLSQEDDKNIMYKCQHSLQ